MIKFLAFGDLHYDEVEDGDRRIIFLAEDFYKAYPSEMYPEMEQKHNRQKYIDWLTELHIRKNEFDVTKTINQRLVKYSTLQYFEKEIGI